jgi:HK97 family phage major capsid protein
MRIKMLTQVGDHKKDAVIPVADDVGNRYVAAGFAEAAPDANPLEGLLDIVASGVSKGLLDAESKGLTPEERARRLRIDPGEAEADKTKSFADFVKCVVVAGCAQLYPGQQGAANERLVNVYKSVFRNSEQKDLAEGSGATGGYTVAPTYGTELLRLAAERSIVRPYANKKTLPAREAYYPMLNQTFVPTGGASAYYGGVSMSWTGEAQPRPATEPAFKQVHVVTHELSGLCKISRTLMSDSMIAMETELRSLFGDAIAYAEDMAFINGDGNAKPRGVTSADATITVAARATASQFKLADAAAMMGAMLSTSRTRARWVMNNTLFAYLVTLANSSGGPVYLANTGTGYGDANLAGPNLLLFGRPVDFTERVNALGTAGDVILADWSKYIVADTGGLEIAASDQYAFNTNQITFRVIQRVDGQPQLDAPFTQQDGTTQLSPFVILHA